MKIEITYIPQGQKNAVTEQYETDFSYPNFYFKGLLARFDKQTGQTAVLGEK